MNALNLYFGFTLAGLIVGLGGALVILILGIFSLKSNYWFRALNTTDKIVFRLAWVGAILLSIGLVLIYKSDFDFYVPIMIKFIILLILISNGCYLTFGFAPVIRREENNPTMTFLNLPMPHKVLIFIAGTISALCWTTQAIIFWLEIINK